MRNLFAFLSVSFVIAATPAFAWDGAGFKKASPPELAKKLSEVQFEVTQEAGTEPPFNNKFWNNHDEGIYVDVVSGEPLFSSRDKYDSGTGWPSFSKPLVKENLVEKRDTELGEVRTEVRSKFANSHLGHVFNDGPAPTGLRYCMNSASLRFIPVADLKKKVTPNTPPVLPKLIRRSRPKRPENKKRKFMLLLILAYLGGMLTIFSPCVLPVVPFVFARSDQPFRRSGLPMLLGMALSFAFFSVLSVAGGRWIVELNQFGRAFALVVFAVVGLSLLFPNVADRLARPFVRLGGVLQKRADAKTGFGSSLLLGASVGLLWAPCAGPILGLLLAGASLGKSNQQTFALLFVFALGAATSLGVAILAGGKVLKVMKKGLGAEEWIKRFLGVAVLLGVVAIALGLDTKILAKLPTLNTNAIEQSIVQKVSGDSSDEDAGALLNGSEAPELNGATQWLNSSPLTIAALRGKVVLVDFWTYSCINCLRSLPYLKAWSEKYKDAGLIVIGVHAPEFAFEKNITSVKNAVRDLALGYPIAIDNDQKIWSAYQNQYWPAHYFIDAKGIVRHHHFGEGSYEESEKVLRDLLKEANGGKELNVATTKVAAVGIEAASSEVETSPETYLGYERQQGFVSRPDLKQDAAQIYEAPANLRLNQWSISGEWKIGSEVATLNSKQGSLSFRFRARDLHLVISGPEGKSIRYRVSIDGKPPGEAHGLDTDASGNGKVESHRLYQLLRLKENDGEHTFRIEFLDPHAEVFAFTFG